MCEIDIGGQICKQIDRDSGKRGRNEEREQKKELIRKMERDRNRKSERQKESY